MRTLGLLVALATAMTVLSTPSRAENGEIAAGILGGLAVGTILGAGAAQPPPAVYVAPPPPPPPPPTCYWAQSEPIWDGYQGIWVRNQVQVCD